MRAGTENSRSMSYFNAVLLTKVFCPGSSTGNGNHAHLGLAFAYSSAMQLSDYDSNNGSIQTWLNSEGTTDGNLTIKTGHCMNKPAKGECPHNDAHVSRHWVLRYPVVWMMDLSTSNTVGNISYYKPIGALIAYLYSQNRDGIHLKPFQFLAPMPITHLFPSLSTKPHQLLLQTHSLMQEDTSHLC